MNMVKSSVHRLASRARVAGLLLSATLAPAARGASPGRVNDAIDRGKAFLYARQHNGNWEVAAKRKPGIQPPNDPSGLQFGGMTALATFALLACGDSPQDEPHLKQAVEWLKHADMRGTYAIGLRAQVWSLLPQDATVRRAEQRDLELLRDGLRQNLRGEGAEANGFFGYGQGLPDAQYDHSVSQFGVLGLWSLAQAGLDVDVRTWRLMDRAWRAQRQRDGAWCYLAAPFDEGEVMGTVGKPSGIGGELLSMTAAGVATLYITQDYASTAAHCDGNAKDADIAAGMQWVARHLDDIDRNEWSRTWDYYTLFGIARIGLASGFKEIGGTDWFQWGADRLLGRQGPDGSWGGGTAMELGEGAEPVDEGVYDTGFALLFLSRGRAPVLFDKLQYDVLSGKRAAVGNWDQRPRDVANLTRYIGRETETTLNWQVVDLTERPADLLDAPVLFVSGNQPLTVSPADVAKLRDYVEQGGLVLGHADCANAAFADGFRKLGAAMFPGEAFHPLPADHPIFASESFSRATMSPPPAVEALDNGVRVQMLLLPTGDPGRVWQTQAFPKDIKRYPFGQLMLDVYEYAVDNQRLPTKGDTYLVRRRADVQVDRTLKVARLRYAGNWDPEPAGWPRLGNILHNGRGIDLDVEPVELGKGQLTKDFALADLTGTAAFTLTAAQRQELADYVAGGGTLLVDAAGGRETFGVAAQLELSKAFPKAPNPLPILPPTSPIYAAGGPLGDVAYRRFARQRLGKLDAPRLRGLDVDGRTAVLLSNEDLAAGLVGQQVDGIVGYAPATAAAIAEHVVLYAGR
jgi:hypothetical protein